MANLIGRVIGRIATAIGWDGTNFRPLAINTDGQLKVVVVSGGGETAKIYGYDGISWREVAVDTSGILGVNLIGGVPTSIRADGQDAGSNLVPLLVYGDGRLRYRWMDGISTLNSSWTFTATAGQKYVDTGAIPANTIWAITRVTIVNTLGTGVPWTIEYRNGANVYPLYYAGSATTNVPQWIDSPLFLTGSDILRFNAVAAAVGNVLRISIFGYSMPSN